MATCPQCQTSVTPEDKFCGHCGYALQAPQKTPRRRTEHAIDVVEVKFRLGVVYYKKNNIKDAVKLWQEVLSLNPRHKGAKDMLKEADAQQQSDT